MADDSQKKPVRGLAKELGWDWVKGGLLLLAPTVPAVIAAVNGYLRDLPLWAIITSATVTAASILTAIRAYVEVSFRLRVKGRLVSGGSTALVMKKSSGVIDHLGVGLHIVNQAAQALEYKVAHANLVIDGRVNQNPTWHDHSAVVTPGGVVTFRLDMVPIATPRAGREYPFTYEATLTYGPVGDDLKYRLVTKLRGSIVTKSPTEVGLFDSMNA